LSAQGGTDLGEKSVHGKGAMPEEFKGVRKKGEKVCR